MYKNVFARGYSRGTHLVQCKLSAYYWVKNDTSNFNQFMFKHSNNTRRPHHIGRKIGRDKKWENWGSSESKEERRDFTPDAFAM
jgi:hypothetical protein